MNLATLLIATGGLLGTPAPGALQFPSKGLLQTVVVQRIPPAPNMGGGAKGGGDFGLTREEWQQEQQLRNAPRKRQQMQVEIAVRTFILSQNR